MPKIYEYFGFVFYFYSNEHEPIHVHVIHNQQETIFVYKQQVKCTNIKHKLQ
jgi:hypothetical protein